MGWLAAATNNNNSRALSCVRVCVRGQSEERVLNSRRNTAINQPTSAREGARQAVVWWGVGRALGFSWAGRGLCTGRSDAAYARLNGPFACVWK